MVDLIICKYFLPFQSLSFHFIGGFLCCARVFKFKRSYLFTFAFVLHSWLILTLQPLFSPYLLYIVPALLLPSSWTQLMLSPDDTERESLKQYLILQNLSGHFLYLHLLGKFLFILQNVVEMSFLSQSMFGPLKVGQMLFCILGTFMFLHRSYWIIIVLYNLSSLRVKTVSYCIFLFSWYND